VRLDREACFSLAAVLVFIVLRLALLVVREPFFDELFTVWSAQLPIGEVLRALRADSGPPLYYLLARVPNVFVLRALSLVFATGTFAFILTRRSLGSARFIAAALLAVCPSATLFAVDARAYAMCGFFVALGVILVREDRPFLAASALLLAAYSHYYGVLYLPLVLLAKPRRRAFAAFASALVFMTPLFWLASVQPREATAWLETQSPLAILNAFAFVGSYPASLFVVLPMWAVLGSAVVTLLAGLRRWAGAPAVLVPIALAVAAMLAGRQVYFPMRFESVLAAPLVIWLATSLQAYGNRVRAALLALLFASGAIALAWSVVDFAQRPSDSYRVAATELRRNLPAGVPVVATGFLYLETVHQLGSDRVRAYPAEQGRHPGWRVQQVTTEALPSSEFIWILERQAPEVTRLGRRRARLLYANDRSMILRVAGLTQQRVKAE
jgi:hypothetical protein